MKRRIVWGMTAWVMVTGLGASAAFAQNGVPFGPKAPPAVPADLKVDDGYAVFFKAHATGTQNYICLPASGGVAWKFVAPQATLFQTFQDDLGQQVATHFLSPNPDEPGVARATWQHSIDSSRVWAKLYKPSSDANYVRPGAIPWFLLTVVGQEDGPEGGSFLTRAVWIQRVNTDGGVAPASGCAVPADTGALALVPYTADYYFYRDLSVR
jgi:hypothetical protein